MTRSRKPEAPGPHKATQSRPPHHEGPQDHTSQRNGQIDVARQVNEQLRTMLGRRSHLDPGPRPASRKLNVSGTETGRRKMKSSLTTAQRHEGRSEQHHDQTNQTPALTSQIPSLRSADPWCAARKDSGINTRGSGSFHHEP